MSIHPIDISIVVLYLITVVVIGIYISKRASQNLDTYFLAGRSVPWYILGISMALTLGSLLVPKHILPDSEKYNTIESIKLFFFSRSNLILIVIILFWLFFQRYLALSAIG